MWNNVYNIKPNVFLYLAQLKLKVGDFGGGLFKGVQTEGVELYK